MFPTKGRGEGGGGHQNWGLPQTCKSNLEGAIYLLEAGTARVKPTLWRHPPPFQPTAADDTMPGDGHAVATRSRAALSDLTNNNKTTRGGSIAGKVRPPRPPGHRRTCARARGPPCATPRAAPPRTRAPRRTPAPDARPPALLLRSPVSRPPIPRRTPRPSRATCSRRSLSPTTASRQHPWTRRTLRT